MRNMRLNFWSKSCKMINVQFDKEEVKNEYAFTVANNHLARVNENVYPENLNKS